MEDLQKEEFAAEIKWLTYLKAFGKSTPEQNEYLEQQIDSNEEARVISTEAMIEYNNSETQNYINTSEFTATPDWSKPNGISNNRKSNIRKILAIATAACIIGAVGVFYFPTLRSGSKTISDKITLQTGTGDVIALTGDQTIRTDGALLKGQGSTLNFTSTEEKSNTAINILMVPSGLDYQIRLDDGTMVWLNSETKMEFPFKFGKRREITITGEAYLEVAPDASCPFIVHLPGDKEVNVLGTSFNVNAYEEQHSKVALVSGSVSFKAGADAVLLQPGMLATTLNENISVAPFDKNFELSWREGVFYIKSQRMEDVAKVLSRWYGKKVVIDNAALADKIFTGKVNRKDPITIFLDNAKELLDFQYEFDNSNVLHLK